MNKNNTIVINNKRYDAKTGAVLSQHSPRHDAPEHGVGRKPAKHAKAHAPAPSQTLMRQAVKRPSASLKRRLKAQGRIDSPVNQPLVSHAIEPSLAHLNTKLVAYAQRLKESKQISHFSSTVSSVGSHTLSLSSQLSQSGHVARGTSSTPTSQQPFYLKKPKTTAELLDYAVQQATSHEQKLPKQSRRHPFKRRVSV